MKTYITKDINETHNWAADFAKTLHAPVTVALHGDLGVGKSEIARTIIQTLCGADTVVPSPTFTIVQSYENGKDNWEASRRVEFKIKTKAEKVIEELADKEFKVTHE